MNKCRSCGAEIIWARTNTGTLTPFDAQPVEGGRYEIVNEIAIYRTGSKPMHQSHFASCKQADQWRKGRWKQS